MWESELFLETRELLFVGNPLIEAVDELGVLPFEGDEPQPLVVEGRGGNLELVDIQRGDQVARR